MEGFQAFLVTTAELGFPRDAAAWYTGWWRAGRELVVAAAELVLGRAGASVEWSIDSMWLQRLIRSSMASRSASLERGGDGRE